MIKRASDIAEKSFMKIDVLNGARRIENTFCKKDIRCYIAYDNQKVAGIITEKELIGAHPNRIAADIMSKKHVIVNANIYGKLKRILI